MVKIAKKNINRELSWLSFNARVLQEAIDPTVPLIERIKFLGIFSSNLDEFFRVRVGTLQRMLDAGIHAKELLAESPKKILKQIQQVVIDLNGRFEIALENVLQELEKEQIYFVNEQELNSKQEIYVRNYFSDEVRPRLVPIMLDSVAEFPVLKNQALYLAIYLVRNREPQETNSALIEIPSDILPRLVVLPQEQDKRSIIMLEDIIRFGLKEIFAIFDYDSHQAYTIKMTRDAELDIDDDVTKSFFEKISKSVRMRRLGEPVRFVYDRDIPNDLLNNLLRRMDLLNFGNLIAGGRYHNAKDFMDFPKIGLSKLRYQKKMPVKHKQIQAHRSLFSAIREKDILLHYPYQSFHHIIDLLREAAIDPKVTSIKMTLYRLAQKSSVIYALINAIKNGKTVTVVMELQARFDEEANIYWTRQLEEAGARIINGVPGLKVHAKLLLISRQEKEKIVRYASIGTGNFNETTATIYCDHSLLTSNKHITNEVNKIFKFMENNYKTYHYKNLFVAPFFMRHRFYKLIRNEITSAKNGKQAYIYVKLNSLVDREMIDHLYEASQAGVTIKMIIRGICSLVPGVAGLSDNIEVISIVDKYLEHSRIFVFCNGGDENYFISSADWMVRNLDNRIEVAVPIYDPDLKNELKTYLELQFRDVKKARIFNGNQENVYRISTSPDQNYRAQEDIYEFLKSK
jgi:polyphosphate kinase